MGPGVFARRLKELREGAGLTQGQLAEKAGLNKFSVAQLEQGRREPTWATVVTLAEALAVDCRAFLETPSAATSSRRGRPRKVTSEEPPADEAKTPRRARNKGEGPKEK